MRRPLFLLFSTIEQPNCFSVGFSGSNRGKRNNRNAVISNLCKELQPLHFYSGQGISKKKNPSLEIC